MNIEYLYTSDKQGCDLPTALMWAYKLFENLVVKYGWVVVGVIRIDDSSTGSGTVGSSLRQICGSLDYSDIGIGTGFLNVVIVSPRRGVVIRGGRGNSIVRSRGTVGGLRGSSSTI